MSNDPCTNLIYIILNYCFHIATHLLAINYLVLYILFRNAQENDDYMIDDVKDWNDTNIMITFVSFYFVCFAQSLVLSIKYTVHIMPIFMTTVFYGLIYIVYMVIPQIKYTCVKNTLLTCYKTNVALSNTNINEIDVYLKYCLIILSVLTVYFIIHISCKNYKKKYYFYKNIIYEIISLAVFYYLFGIIVIIIPVALCCKCGGESQDIQINMGDVVNGNEYCSNEIMV